MLPKPQQDRLESEIQSGRRRVLSERDTFRFSMLERTEWNVGDWIHESRLEDQYREVARVAAARTRA